MNEHIKFNSELYPEVKKYLDGVEKLHGFPNGDGTIYRTNWRGEMKGLILQRCNCSSTDEGMISFVNTHPSFEKIKKDLGEIIQK